MLENNIIILSQEMRTLLKNDSVLVLYKLTAGVTAMLIFDVVLSHCLFYTLGADRLSLSGRQPR